MLEGLEERWVPSQAAGGLPIVADSSPPTGEFFHNDQQFNYTTPDGTHVEIKIVGVGSLKGTTVDSSGALHLLFSKTNAYTRIVSDVHGGTGQAALASIFSYDLYTNSAVTSLSGIGASLLRTINLPNFNLIAGGTINVDSGIANLNLNSVGPNTQINLRVLPTSYLTTFATANSNSGVTANTNPTTSNTTPSSSSSSSSKSSSSSSSSSSSTSSSAITTTSSNNNSSVIVTGAFLVQSLAGINGEFATAGNIINVSNPQTPGPAPAPPGLVLKINNINGNITTPTPPNLLTDNVIFGLDGTTGQVDRFNLTPTTSAATGEPTMAKQTGTLDTSFHLSQPPVGSSATTPPVAISLGRDVGPGQNPTTNQLVLLVSTGAYISVYNPTTGVFMGSFSTNGFDATTLGSTDTLTVMGDVKTGDVTTNQLEMIDVYNSLQAQTAQPPTNPSGYPAPGVYTPPPGFSLVGGLTGLAGSNQVYPTVGATFNPFQTTDQLGLLTAATSTPVTNSSGGLTLIRQFSTVSENAIKPFGSYVEVPSNNPQVIDVGLSEGSVDSSLALNTIGTTSTSGQYTNTISLLGPVSLTRRGTITLDQIDPSTGATVPFTDPITDLTESFRPDLTGSTAAGTGPALIDVQGNIQSLRGLTANGLVLNNTGYLNLIRIGQITNSTILAQPLGHILTPQAQRSNVLLISSNNRDFGTRGGVNILVSGLYQIGPLSLTSTNPTP